MLLTLIYRISGATLHYLPILCLDWDGGITELLLKYGADPNIKNNNDDTTLYWACRRRNSEVIELLLKYGADPAAHNNSALYSVFDKGYNEIIKLLLQYRADPNVILGCACRRGDIDLVELLLKLGVTYSPWCFMPAVICAVFACLSIAGAIKAAFFTEKKEPSPEFAEVITEKVVNNVELNAEDNSQEIGNALA